MLKRQPAAAWRRSLPACNSSSALRVLLQSKTIAHGGPLRRGWIIEPRQNQPLLGGGYPAQAPQEAVPAIGSGFDLPRGAVFRLRYSRAAATRSAEDAIGGLNS